WAYDRGPETGPRVNAKAAERPSAAVLKDLRARGRLNETLVLWGGEFGRTPTAQLPDGGYVKEVGRDHNPFGFTMWLAGGGIKGGTIYGETDEYGYLAIKDQVHVHDVHTTIPQLLRL